MVKLAIRLTILSLACWLILNSAVAAEGAGEKGALAELAKQAAAEADNRWKPWQMELGRRLTALRLAAERGIALALARWRRR